MRHRFVEAIALALTLATTCVMAHAQSQPVATILESQADYVVQTDGRYTLEQRGTVRIDTPQAVQRFGQIPRTYSSSLQQLDVLAAYVIGKDGKRTDVPPDRILTQQTPQSAAAPTFDDSKVKVVIYPGVEVGSTLHLHTRLTQLKPQFPGHFSMVETVSAAFDVDSAVITVRAPAGLGLQADAVALSGGAVEPDRPGTQRWRWEVKGLKALTVEGGAVAPQDASPRVAVTTFANDQAAADAYQERARPQAKVTPTIQALADDITRGVTDRRAQAEAIYRWVLANIRYVAIFLDVGGVVPHAADEIAKVRYGDCKDQTTIMGALLAAKGIGSSPVLVNADLRFWKPTVAATPGVFNHAILHLPEFDVYLDSTSALAPFGTLAVMLRGKQALVLDGGNGQARAVTLPLATPAQDRVRVALKLAMESDGTLRGNSDVESQGLFDLVARTVMTSIAQGAEAQVMGQLLAMTGQNGSGTFSRGDPRDLTRSHRYSTAFTLPGYVQLPGPGAFIVPQGLTSFSGIAVTFEQLGLAQRTLPMPMLGRRVEETITLQLLPDVKPTALLRGVQLKWAHGSYESQVKAEGATVTISRVLELALPGPLLAPKDYTSFRTFGQAVMRDLRSQIVY